MANINNHLEFNPENHVALYEHYESHEPNERALAAAHSLASMFYKPIINTAANADIEIEERALRGDRFIVASNHLRAADQFPLSAAMKQTEALSSLVGRTFALAKAEYFAKPVLRKRLETLGTIPVFRSQDVDGKQMVLAGATRSLVQTSAARIANGWNMLIFPEGTRNTGNPRVLGKIHKGIGRIATEVSRQDTNVSIIPMAIWWGDGDKTRRRRPQVFIHRPITGPFRSRRNVVNDVTDGIRESLARIS